MALLLSWWGCEAHGLGLLTGSLCASALALGKGEEVGGTGQRSLAPRLQSVCNSGGISIVVGLDS